VTPIGLTDFANAIDQVGIPIILAWFMIRMEKILTENTRAQDELQRTVAKLIELIEER
jgi:hypothetical protein